MKTRRNRQQQNKSRRGGDGWMTSLFSSKPKEPQAIEMAEMSDDPKIQQQALQLKQIKTKAAQAKAQVSAKKNNALAKAKAIKAKADADAKAITDQALAEDKAITEKTEKVDQEADKKLKVAIQNQKMTDAINKLRQDKSTLGLTSYLLNSIGIWNGTVKMNPLNPVFGGFDNEKDGLLCSGDKCKRREQKVKEDLQALVQFIDDNPGAIGSLGKSQAANFMADVTGVNFVGRQIKSAYNNVSGTTPAVSAVPQKSFWERNKPKSWGVGGSQRNKRLRGTRRN